MSEKLQYKEIVKKVGCNAPWRLLDFAEKIDDTHLAGFKNVSADEEYFVGHFPVHPIMPGVLQLEAVRQLALCFLPGDIRVRQFEKVKFRRQVLPGDRMLVEIEIINREGALTVCKAKCSTVSGLCSEATVTFTTEPGRPAGLQDIPALDGEFARTADIAMDTDKVLGLMPHRFPFLQIDYVARFEGTKIIAVKNVSCNESFVNAGLDFVPESLMCEIAAQSGCACVLSRPENAGKLGFFMAIDKAVFHRQVVPGEQMLIEIDLPESKSRFGKGSGFIRVGSEIIAEVALMFALVDA
ncbi:MAG: hypothetical protein IKA71_02285 [Lentisphaeria bacterium]|nr:hypothetical protein [Lentisphaeria bacterium]